MPTESSDDEIPQGKRKEKEDDRKMTGRRRKRGSERREKEEAFCSERRTRCSERMEKEEHSIHWLPTNGILIEVCRADAVNAHHRNSKGCSQVKYQRQMEHLICDKASCYLYMTQSYQFAGSMRIAG